MRECCSIFGNIHMHNTILKTPNRGAGVHCVWDYLLLFDSRVFQLKVLSTMPTKSVHQGSATEPKKFFTRSKSIPAFSLQLAVCFCHFLELSAFPTQLLAKLKSFWRNLEAKLTSPFSSHTMGLWLKSDKRLWNLLLLGISCGTYVPFGIFLLY